MCAALVVALFAIAVPEGWSPAPASPTLETSKARPAAGRQLKPGPWLGRPGRPAQDLLAPRFSNTVEVLGRASRELNQTMAVWWEHFNLTTASVYGRGTAFRLAPPQGSIDLVPLVDWLAAR